MGKSPKLSFEREKNREEYFTELAFCCDFDDSLVV